MKNHLLTIILLLLGFQFSCSTGEENLKEAQELRTKALKQLEQKNYDLGLNDASKAFDISKSGSDSLGMAESLFLLARASALLGKFEAAIDYGKIGAEMSRQLQDFDLEYKNNNVLSWSYFETDHDFEQILEHEKRQVFVVNQLEDDAAKAMVYNNFGYDYTIAGTLPLDSLIQYSKYANDYFAKTENNNGRWYTLMNLTWQHRLKKDFEKSEYFGKLSVERAIKDDDRHAIIEANTNLGETLIAQGKINEALPYYQDALNQSTQKEDRDKYVFDVYYSKFLWLIKAREEAIWRLEEALEFLKTGEVFYEMLGRAYLADFYFQNGETEKAKEQIAILKNPRNHYFSFENKLLGALTEIKILRKQDEAEKAEEIMNNFLANANAFGAEWLVEMLEHN